MGKNTFNKIKSFISDLDETIRTLDIVASKPMPMAICDYKQIIKTASEKLKASKAMLSQGNNKTLLACTGCYLMHTKLERINGEVNAFGLTPLLCPNCGSEGFDVCS